MFRLCKIDYKNVFLRADAENIKAFLKSMKELCVRVGCKLDKGCVEEKLRWRRIERRQ